MQTLDVGGHKVGYLAEGAGDLVDFAHCSLGFSGLFLPCIRGLSDRYRCVSVDLPGHGRSDRGDKSISLQQQAVRYVAALIEAEGGGPAHLVGLSLGGAIMGRVALAYPALARSLTLIEPIYFHLLTDSRPEFAAENLKTMEPVIEACNEGRYHDGARAFMEGWGQPGQFDRMPESGRDAIARALAHVSRDFPMAHAWVPGQITRDDLRSIQTPTLLMEGAATQPSASAILDELAALMPRTERASIPGAGHLSPVDEPAEVAARLAAFFATLEG